MGGVLKPLVAVEVQLRSDPLLLLLHRQTNGVQHQIHGLLCPGFVGHDAVVDTDPGSWTDTILLALCGCKKYPLPICCWACPPGTRRLSKIFVFMYLLPHLLPLSAPPDLRQQAVFLHDTQDSLGIAVDALCFSSHQPHPAVAIGTKACVPAAPR